MLIDTSQPPSNSVYYLGSKVLEIFILDKNKKWDSIEQIYREFISKYSIDISFSKFLFVLDRIYLIDKIDLDSIGYIYYNDN